MDEGERHAAQAVAPLLGDFDASGVGRDDDGVRGVHASAHILDEGRHRPEVVDGPVEEPLGLGGVQVHAHDPVRPGRLEQVGEQARRDRLAALVLLVLARIRIRGGDGRDALGRGSLGGVDHDELFHHPLVDRVGM